MKEISKNLTEEQKRLFFEGGTERPFSGEYVDHKEKGDYSCANCGNKLFSSDTKFDTVDEPGLEGWPSFDKAIGGSVEFKQDNSFGMKRIEVLCKKCGGHLGHIFPDNKTKTKEHYCINSACLNFKKT